MTLIWAEGFSGAKALAPSWRRWTIAAARAADTSLTAAELGTAMIEALAARASYDALAAEAEGALAAAAAAGQARTHMLVAGVGRYQDARIPALTTSVFGAWDYTDWMLTRFRHRNRPLGSVEMLLSCPTTLGDWRPPPASGAVLGIAKGDSLPVEASTFANLKAAFNRWLVRAGTHPENAAFFYFSGHGVWKAATLVLPEDARLPASGQSAENLVNVRTTQFNMFNAQPSVQCFFIDACQEISPALLQNLDADPAEPLHRPTNGVIIPQRDACTYYGSYTGRKAYGPDDKPPFFTQELLACLERRGASEFDGVWLVNTQSLWRALEAAYYARRETEGMQDIQFSKTTEASSITADLCHIESHPEVFLKIHCLPPDTMPRARLYVDSAGARHFRPAAQPTAWYTPVAQGNCAAGVEFDANATLEPTTNTFEAMPPVFPVALKVQAQGGA